MADFTTNVQPVQGQIAPVAPVQDNTAAEAVQGVGQLLGGLGAAVINANTYAQQVKQQKYKASALGDLQQNIMRVQDLQQQGVMTQDQALRRIRLTTASSLANHPLLQDDINKLVGTLTGTALQEDISKGTQAEQDQHSATQKYMEAALQAGYFKPTDPPEVQRKMADAYQGVQLALAQLKQQSDVLAYQKSQVELGNAKLSTIAAKQGIANAAVTAQRNNIGLQQDIHKLNFTNHAGDVALSFLPKFDKDANDLINDKSKTPEQIQMGLDAIGNNVQDTISGIAIGADSTGSIPAMGDIFKRRLQVYKDQASGKLSADLAAQQLTNLTAVSSLALVNKSPDLLKLTSLSHVLPAAANVVQGNIANEAVKLLRNNGAIPDSNGNTPTVPGNPTHSDAAEQKAVQQYSNILLENLKQANSGKVVDPEHQAEINNNFNNMMAGFGTYAGTTKDATGLKVAVQTFAKPEFGLYASNPKNGFDADASEKAGKAFDQYYKTALLPLIQNEFEHASVVVGTMPSTSAYGAAKGLTQQKVVPAPTQIHPVFADGRVRFVADDPTIAGANDKATDLNNRVAPILQTMIKADAHLHQSTNYEFYYNELLNTIQPPDNNGIELNTNGNLPVPSK